MKIRKVLRFLIKSEPKFQNATLCGVSIKIVENSIRLKVDQDDAWWFYLAKAHNVIFDIGCNVGSMSLIALLQNPHREILLVDPNVQALNTAQLNLITNNLGYKANYFCGFVSDNSDQTIKFYSVGRGAAGSKFASHAKTASSMNSFTNVKTVSLDDLYKYYNKKPDLVKIDVEGAELEVLEGAKNIVSETKCKLFIEMHSIEGSSMEASGNKVLEWCKEVGYKAWYLKIGKEMENGTLIKDRGKCHLLLIDENEEYPNYLVGVEQYSELPIIV